MPRHHTERTTLPGIAHVRITGDPAATQRIVDLLAEHFTMTDPAPYSGGRSYLDIDTRTPADAKGEPSS
ncbi:hypothetical protein [Streptomyces sp. NPDC001404]|uniref:hypothetical protein n=1 Tax=Streptomyces sp. NPDC001404 TaxID=3364571 RepID=UPI0036848CA5